MDEKTKTRLALAGAGGLLLLLFLLRDTNGAAARSLPPVEMPPAYDKLDAGNKTVWILRITLEGIMLASAVQAYTLDGEPLKLPVAIGQKYWIVSRARDLAPLDLDQQAARQRELVEAFVSRVAPQDTFVIRIEGDVPAESVLAVTETLKTSGNPYSVETDD